MRQDNRIVCDLNKVQWARFYYKNQYSDKVNVKPTKPTVNACEFDPDEMHITGTQSLMAYAHANQLLDVWTPHVYLKVTANESLLYSGDKALSIWKEWNRRIFKKK